MLIAHRGESILAPENTLTAIDLAWSKGSRAVELDIHLTKDGRLFVCHDADLRRTGGKELLIREHSLADLKRVDVGAWMGRQWAGIFGPELEEVLAGMPSDGQLVIEIKDGTRTVTPLAKLLRKFDSCRCSIISFLPEVIAECKRVMPSVPAYLTLVQEKDAQSGQWKPTADQLIASARSLGADGLALHACDAVDRRLIDALHGANLKVYVWTVDDPKWAGQFLDAGVDGLMSNRAAFIAAELKL